MMAMPEMGLSLMDKIAWVWLGLAFASAAYVAYHQFTKTSEMKVMKWSWTLATLYTGLVGFIAYRLSRHEPESTERTDEKSTDETSGAPLWKQTVEATMHCLAGCATGVTIALVTTSLLRLSMGFETVAEYVVSFALGLFLFQALAAKQMVGCSYGQAVKLSCLAQWLSMNAVMAGMIPVMVILMSRDMSAMEPTSVRFWGMLSLASLVGMVLSYPVNWWLVRNRLQPAMGEPATSGRGEQEDHHQAAPAASKRIVTMATLLMLVGGIALAARLR